MNDRHKIIAWVVINNTMRFLGFVYLTWSFEKWWLVLFSLLFFDSAKLDN